MVGKTPRILKNEKQRLENIKMYCGCLPCLLTGHPDRHTSIEHVTEHGRRVGVEHEQHANTIGLCVWHHFSVCVPGQHVDEMVSYFGPSLGQGRRKFEEFFGDEINILIPLQNFMLDRFADHPWPEYSVPRRVARDVRNEWIALNHANDRSPSHQRESSS